MQVIPTRFTYFMTTEFSPRGYLRVQGSTGLYSCQGALPALQVLDHHLAKSITHVHLDTQKMLSV